MKIYTGPNGQELVEVNGSLQPLVNAENGQKFYEGDDGLEEYAPEPLVQQAQDTSPGQAALIGAGKSLHDLWAGMKKLGYNISGDKEALDNLVQEQRYNNKVYGALEDEHPISTFAGGMAPYMMVPGAGVGSAARLAGNVGIGAGLGGMSYSENAPLSAALGGAGGALGHGMSKAGGKLYDKYIRSTPMNANTQRAMSEGYQISPAQRIDNPGLRKFEASMQSSPLTANAISKIDVNNQNLLNRQFKEASGMKSSGSDITRKDLVDAGDYFNKEYSDKLDKLAFTRDIDFNSNLRDIAQRNFSDYKGDSSAFLDEMGELVGQFKGGVMTGKQYQDIRSKMHGLASKWKDTDKDPGFVKAYSDMAQELDALAYRNMDEGMQKLNQEYRIFKTATKGGNKQLAHPPLKFNELGTANLSAPKMGNVLTRTQNEQYMKGRDTSDLYEGLRFMNEVRPPVGDSGTATRQTLGDFGRSLSNVQGLGDLARFTTGNIVAPIGGAALYASRANPIGRNTNLNNIAGEGVGNALRGLRPKATGSMVGLSQYEELMKLLDEEQE